jgi:hypothetical protein
MKPVDQLSVSGPPLPCRPAPNRGRYLVPPCNAAAFGQVLHAALSAVCLALVVVAVFVPRVGAIDDANSGRRLAFSASIVDLVVEGVSLAVTERSDFGSIIQNRGLDGLIEALRAKGSESGGAGATQ